MRHYASALASSAIGLMGLAGLNRLLRASGTKTPTSWRLHLCRGHPSPLYRKGSRRSDSLDPWQWLIAAGLLC